MKLQRPIILLVFIMTLLFSCSKKESIVEKGVTLTGKVNYPQQGLILLERLESDKLVTVDTVELDKNNGFSVVVPDDEPLFYKLNFYNKQAVNLIVNKTDINVLVDGNNAQGKAVVTGSKDLDYLNEVNDMVKNFQVDTKPLSQEFNLARQSGDMQEILRVQGLIQSKQEDVVEAVKTKIDKMGTSIAAIFASNTIMTDDHYPFLKGVADKFQKDLPNSIYTEQFVLKVAEMGKLAVGTLAPDFTLSNPEGKLISLSSFRGKYVLVDFWAKWCTPCRRENPNVVRAYNKFHDKGFDILGVSLDRNKEDWMKAIEEDGLVWNHVSDLKFWQSEVVPLYGIKGIPFAVLLDPEGKIVAKNLRGAQLDQKLAELLN